MSLPTAHVSEQFILAWILTNPTSINEVASRLPRPEVLHHAKYRKLYQRMLEMSARGMVPDVAAVTTDQTAAQLVFIGEIITTLPESLYLQVVLLRQEEQLDTHVRLIMDAYVKRETALAYERGEAAEEVMARFSDLSRAGTIRVFDAAEMADMVYAMLTDKQKLLPYPFRELNRATAGGMRKGEMIVVAARQAQGKSAFLQNIALHLATTNHKVLFVSAEMSAKDLAGRWTTILSKQQVLRPDGLNNMAAAMDGMGALAEIQHNLVGAEMTSVAGIEMLLKKQEFDLVCVDYLQKLTSINPKPKSEYERVSEISRTLDNLCQKYQIPMVVAAQFNRRAEGQQPMISDLRDSGQIEADADMVISLWQKEKGVAVNGREKVSVDILKNRNGYSFFNGESGLDHFLWFDKPHFTFSDPDMSHQEGPF